LLLLEACCNLWGDRLLGCSALRRMTLLTMGRVGIEPTTLGLKGT
jgi:hypothetical protein